MKEKLLFVTKGGENCDEGFSYVLDLAKTLNAGVAVLMIYPSRMMNTFEDVMSAVAFAEEGEFETAREILREDEYTPKEVIESKKDIRQTTLKPWEQIQEGGARAKRLRGKIMADSHGNPTKKPYSRAIFWGIISAIAYVTIFMYKDIVMSYFTLGSWYATLPIITVFFFSFVHGAFCSYLLSTLGIEPARKK